MTKAQKIALSFTGMVYERFSVTQAGDLYVGTASLSDPLRSYRDIPASEVPALI